MQMLKYKLIIIEICFKFVRAMADNKIKPELVRNSASRLVHYVSKPHLNA